MTIVFYYARLSLFTMSQDNLKPAKPVYLDIETQAIVFEGLAKVNAKRAHLRIAPLKLGEYVNRILRAYHKDDSKIERVA